MKLEGSHWVSEAAAESTHRTDRSEDDLCPTIPSCQQHLVSIWKQSTYAALQWSTVDIVTAELADGACSVLMSVHFNECETAIRLETSLLNKAKVLKQRDKVVLGRVWG